MISIDEALELVLRELAPLGPEQVPLAEAAGRVAAAPARSAVDLPPFDRSAMDGYAVRAADTAPGVALRLAGGVAAGEVATRRSSPAPPRASRPARRSRRAPTRCSSPSSPSSATAPWRRSGRSSRACTCATAARTCTRATSSRPPASH